ncbi:MAG TPA: thioesterase family protein, partial [Gammaproteobacteria bacterium]|nr:thioesterase family protein [Gammaproteobacteria bacterium]
VPFHDADPMGVTWHGNYFRYLETARSALLRSIGYDYAQMTASGYSFPVVDARIKYVKPTTFGSRLKVKATLEEYEERLKIAYLITDSGTGNAVTTASTTHAAVRAGSGELCFRSPQLLIDRVAACLRRPKRRKPGRARGKPAP